MGDDNGDYIVGAVGNTVKEEMQLTSSTLQFNETVLYDIYYAPTTTQYTYSTLFFSN